MKMKIIFLIIAAIYFFSSCASNLHVRTLEYNIGIEFKNNNSKIYKIFILTDTIPRSTGFMIRNDYIPDFSGFESFETTRKLWGWTDEYSEKWRNFKDENFSDFRDDHLNRGYDFNTMSRLFNIWRFNEIGYPNVRNVLIAYDMYSFNIIANEYIISQHFSEIINVETFDNNLLVFVIISFTSLEFPTNPKIVNILKSI